MKHIFTALIVAVSALFVQSALGADQESEVLMSEYKRLHAFVETLEPDGQVGGLLNFKKIDGYEILWKLARAGDPSDNTVIRLYNEHSDGTEDFAVSYMHATHIAPGRAVIRRFVGPIVGPGWRNDTVDVESGEYLGSQGARDPLLNDSDRAIVDAWQIELRLPLSSR